MVPEMSDVANLIKKRPYTTANLITNTLQTIAIIITNKPHSVGNHDTNMPAMQSNFWPHLFKKKVHRVFQKTDFNLTHTLNFNSISSALKLKETNIQSASRK